MKGEEREREREKRWRARTGQGSGGEEEGRQARTDGHGRPAGNTVPNTEWCRHEISESRQERTAEEQ